MTQEVTIRPCERRDVATLRDIYNHYVENTVVTFEEVPVSTQEMGARVAACTEHFPWLVCEVGDAVVGYAYANRWHGRSAYRYSVEVTVYLEDGESGKGYGGRLYHELFHRLGGRAHALVAGISLPNEGSVRLHEKFGFRKVAHFHEVGRKFDRWVDVGYWQKLVDP